MALCAAHNATSPLLWSGDLPKARAWLAGHLPCPASQWLHRMGKRCEHPSQGAKVAFAAVFHVRGTWVLGQGQPVPCPCSWGKGNCRFFSLCQD